MFELQDGYFTNMDSALDPRNNVIKRLFFKSEIDYSEILLLRPPKMKTSYLLKTSVAKFKLFFLHFLLQVYLWLETTFGTVQKWSLRPLLDSPKGGLNIGILLYIKKVTDDILWGKAEISLCIYAGLWNPLLGFLG